MTKTSISALPALILQRQQPGQAPEREQDPERAAGERKHDALDQNLSNDPPPSCAKRGANRGLATAIDRARRKQPRTVCAGDEQHDGITATASMLISGRRSRVKTSWSARGRKPLVSDPLHRPDVQRGVGRLQRSQLRRRRLKRAIVAKAARDPVVEAIARTDDRQPYIRQRWRFLLSRQHADHFVGLASKRQRLPDRALCRAECPLRKPLIDDADARPTRLLVFDAGTIVPVAERCRAFRSSRPSRTRCGRIPPSRRPAC